ncbi:XP_029637188.1uncharacterized protein LOC115212419 [Octopus vulgaris]|uniref:XP_029637188.1uncharacterized protein LOC115212419 n=4 Tax=Octopus TaxID=6643 RepID=A0AA36F2M7_OCTVU|nr:uncharacterized protein LOC115212419 [Octopus sinensis]XP_036358890.1 uncharacterized protein LOC115212419 [Octopus sinensis]XP_036358891.1 uncharacterized protein LOC115212419 [Octopus sinensis]XP_052824100.1 uncharacterized protein LOC106884362 isoform X2 [Octopus bimaculoides]XP_052824101.1 uncharacterized protein LOC106884362 isoform X2 [Octopus bimaculoides]XP_052824102.1 uncharacterized protein LOC106884362 isoform X2 [Octopus bimaculoides]XP_052824103.1 uncharacterized protein LOC10
MRHLLVIFWCCIFHMLCATTGGRYIDYEEFPFKSYEDPAFPEGTLYHDRKNLEGPVLNRFSQFLRAQRESSSTLSDEQFVQEMFSFFDVNRNQMISKSEFRAALELLGIVRWNF